MASVGSFLHGVRFLLTPALVPPVVASESATPRLLLRPYRMDDAEDWLAIENDATIRRGLSWPQRTRDTRSVEIGWLLRAPFNGHGLASEAATGMLDVAFEEAGASTVTAVVHDGNEASAKLARRLGFRPATRGWGATTFVLTREDRRRQSSQTDAARTDAALGMVSPQAPWRGRA